jgi:predicted dehydrogenase
MAEGPGRVTTARPGRSASAPKGEKKVRLGVVGMGIGRPNARAVARNPRGEVTALCDLVPALMDDFAKDLVGFGNPAPKRHASYQEMCRDPEVDAVFVGTPNQLHVPVALEAVRNGKHVIVTKPLADSEAAARELVAEAERAGVVNMMSLSTRFGPGTTFLRQQAAQGTFGSCITRGRAACDATAYRRGTWASSGKAAARSGTWGCTRSTPSGRSSATHGR